MIRDFFTPIRAMIRKEFQQITRDRRMLGILVAAPSLQLFVLGFAASFEVDRMQIAICDEDRTPASRDVLQGLLADGTFVRVAAPDCSQPGEALQEGIADVAVVLHPGFGEQVARNEPAPVQVLVDGSNPIVGRYASTAIESWFALRTAERMTHLAEIQAGITGVASHASMVRVAPMMLYNPRMKSPIFLIPGVAAMLLLIVTTLATAMGIPVSVSRTAEFSRPVTNDEWERLVVALLEMLAQWPPLCLAVMPTMWQPMLSPSITAVSPPASR